MAQNLVEIAASEEHENGRAEACALILEDLKGVLEQEGTTRASYIKAIALLAQFVRATLGIRAGARMAGLAIALSDLNHGTVSEILQPAHRNNRTLDTSWEWSRRAHLALALECHHRYGANLQQASQLLAHSAKVRPETLINWRKELMARRVNNELANLMFQNGLKRIAELRTQELKSAAREFSKIADQRRLV
jgi:hypothetical protein